jgi:hypothetical protein
MTYAGYIKREGDTHFFWSFVEDRRTVQTYSGYDGVFIHRFNGIKASAALLLVDQFLVKDVVIIDRGKDIHSYSELRKRVQAYVSWGHANREHSPESVIDNAIRVKQDFIDKMINMISPEHAERKELIFLAHGIEILYKEHKEFKL